MTESSNAGPAYKRFLAFFSLAQRERLDGLDATYFSDMTQSEKDMAFLYLKNGFEVSEENIRGLYLCNPSEAVALFKETLRKPIPKGTSKREDDALLMGRVLMASYICNDSPTANNINSLVRIDVSSGSEDVRNAFYRHIPSEPTTEEAIARLTNGVLTEADRMPLASATQRLMACYGLLFNMHDNEYKRIYRGLISSDISIKKQHIRTLQSRGSPIFV